MPEIKETYSYELCDRFQLEDLAERKLFINFIIDDSILNEITYHILRFNAQDKGLPREQRKPILLYCTSNGGSVVDGFSLIDVILMSKTPVYTVNLGYQYSMGLLIGLAGEKRFATKNATYLLHDGSNFAYNSSGKLKDQMKFNDQQEERIKDYILTRTKLTPEEYDEKYRVEWYMFSDEAKEKGITDFIVGEDVDLDEIV